MSVTFQADGIFGAYVPHTCEDLCADYLPAGHDACPGDYVEAGVNVSNANAAALLRALGLPTEDLSGACPADDFLARVSLALVVRPDVTRADAVSLPGWAGPGRGASEFHFGIDDAYVVRRLEALREVGEQALSLGLEVTWA